MTSQQQIDRLMMPRYIVTALWPNSDPDMYIGKILNSSSNNMIQKLVFNIGGDYWRLPEELDNYPHLFKKLQWWERRHEFELPRYLKVSQQGEPFMVHEFYKVKHYSGKEDSKDHVRLIENNDVGYLAWFEPALEADYLSYITSTKIKEK